MSGGIGESLTGGRTSRRLDIAMKLVIVGSIPEFAKKIWAIIGTFVRRHCEWFPKAK